MRVLADDSHRLAANTLNAGSHKTFSQTLGLIHQNPALAAAVRRKASKKAFFCRAHLQFLSPSGGFRRSFKGSIFFVFNLPKAFSCGFLLLLGCEHVFCSCFLRRLSGSFEEKLKEGGFWVLGGLKGRLKGGLRGGLQGNLMCKCKNTLLRDVKSSRKLIFTMVEQPEVTRRFAFYFNQRQQRLLACKDLAPLLVSKATTGTWAFSKRLAAGPAGCAKHRQGTPSKIRSTAAP